MKVTPLVTLIFICVSFNFYSQVKIGNNPSSIHSTSILELESNDKVLVVSRLTTTQINAISPLEGAIVYNTDTKCIYIYNASTWRNLCEGKTTVITSPSAPTGNIEGDIWINDSNFNLVSVWDGTQWVAINANPKRGNGIPSTTTVTNAIAGDIYVDTSNGNLYTYDGTNWINQSNTTVSANNGLTVNSDTVQLGGSLINPTTITTDNTNTLALEGLEDGDVTTDDIVTIDKTTGALKKVPASNLLREEVIRLTATNGQLVFNGLTLRTTDKINVYRNGVRIDFTIINPTTIEIEPDAICYDGDEIRIVQLY